MEKFLRRAASVSAITFAIGSLSGANAQDATQSSEAAQGQDDKSDIVVTATRRATLLSDVPISVTAENQASLDQKGVKEISALGRVTPGLSFAPAANRQNTISIRGIASDVGASTTGVYIDDTPIQIRQIGAGRSSGTVFPTIFDLERIEILRGPQGTLFGAGSQGGTVRFITPEPSLLRTSMYARSEIAATKGGDPSYEAGMAYGGPIVDERLGFRVSGFYRKQGGWVDGRSFRDFGTEHKNENSSDALVLRGALKWKLGDAVTVTPSLLYQRTKFNGSDFIWDTLLPSGDGTSISANIFPDNGTDRFYLPSAKIEIDLGGISLVSNSSYFNRKQETVTDYTTFFTEILTGSALSLPPVPTFAATSEFHNRQKIFTQEVRLQSGGAGPLNWVIGAFYQKAKQSSNQRTPTSGMDDLTLALIGIPSEAAFGYPLLPADPSLYFNAPLTANLHDNATDEQLAGFGQIDYSPREWITLTAGLRVANTKFSFTNSQEGQLAGGLTSSSGKQEQTPVTPKFGVSVRPAAGQLLYATAAKGFRTGGANTPVSPVVCGGDLADLGLTSSPNTYASDTVWSYEVGTKNRLFDNKVKLAASAFYIKWKDIQRQVSLQCGYFFIANAASAVSKGFDAQIDVQPVQGLTLAAGVAYNKAAYTQGVLGGVIDPVTGERATILSAGDRLSVPPWTVHLSAEYAFDVASHEMFVRGDYDYRSSYQNSPRAPAVSFDPVLARASSVQFLALRAGMVVDRWNISLFADNITNSKDKTYVAHTSTSAALVRYAIQRPRTFGLTASYRY